MFERRHLLALLALSLVACEPAEPPKPKLTPEQEMREKFSETPCFISSNQEKAPILKRWHTRRDCPDLEKELMGYYKPRKPNENELDYMLRPGEMVKMHNAVGVTVKQEGQFDSQGFKYDIQHCPKCAY